MLSMLGVQWGSRQIRIPVLTPGSEGEGEDRRYIPLNIGCYYRDSEMGGLGTAEVGEGGRKVLPEGSSALSPDGPLSMASETILSPEGISWSSSDLPISRPRHAHSSAASQACGQGADRAHVFPIWPMWGAASVPSWAVYISSGAGEKRWVGTTRGPRHSWTSWPRQVPLCLPPFSR